MKKKRVATFLSGLLVFCWAMTAQAVTYTVDDDSGADFSSIQTAIDKASANGGGTVLVAAGTYYENLTLKSNVHVRGAGISTTTVNGNRSGHVVTATGVENVVFDGFAVVDSRLSSQGARHLYLRR